MFGMGMGEIVVILIVALLFIGPDKLPGAAKSIGQGIRKLRRHTQDLQQTIEQDETVGGAVRELKSVLRGDDAPAASRSRPLPKPADGALARTAPPAAASPAGTPLPAGTPPPAAPTPAAAPAPKAADPAPPTTNVGDKPTENG